MANAPALAVLRPPPFVRRSPLVEAAERAPVLGSRRGVTWLALPSRTALNRCTSPDMPFEWTINPYRGCEFACRYCYARYTHAYIGLEDPGLFETRIFAKTGAAEALERDLAKPAPWKGRIALGTATDPYQPAERRLGITRSLLEVFARHEGLRLSITTKSDLILRDLDLLREIRRRNRLGVNFTVTTLSRSLARRLEPRAPRPALRLEALRALAQAGIPSGVFIMPVVPGLTDAPESLEAIVAAAARGGASWIAHQVLFLRSSSKSVFLDFLAGTDPKLAWRYRRVYGASAYHGAAYRKGISDLMEKLRRRHGLDRRESPHASGESGALDACAASGAPDVGPAGPGARAGQAPAGADGREPRRLPRATASAAGAHLPRAAAGGGQMTLSF